MAGRATLGCCGCGQDGAPPSLAGSAHAGEPQIQLASCAPDSCAVGTGYVLSSSERGPELLWPMLWPAPSLPVQSPVITLVRKAPAVVTLCPHRTADPLGQAQHPTVTLLMPDGSHYDGRTSVSCCLLGTLCMWTSPASDCVFDLSDEGCHSWGGCHGGCVCVGWMWLHGLQCHGQKPCWAGSVTGSHGLGAAVVTLQAAPPGVMSCFTWVVAPCRVRLVSRLERMACRALNALPVWAAHQPRPHCELLDNFVCGPPCHGRHGPPMSVARPEQWVSKNWNARQCWQRVSEGRGQNPGSHVPILRSPATAVVLSRCVYVAASRAVFALL